jgi:hypothetical protein
MASSISIFACYLPLSIGINALTILAFSPGGKSPVLSTIPLKLFVNFGVFSMALVSNSSSPAAPERDELMQANPLPQTIAKSITISLEGLLWFILAVLTVFLRLWMLGARVMSHDESLHVYYSWLLANGNGYAHNPMMHGRFCLRPQLW